MNRVTTLIKDDRGSISALTVILLAVFMGFLAYVIDLGHLHTVHNELRNAADACALRGARAFLPDDIPVTGPSPIALAPDDLRAKAEASATIGDNRSDNVSLTYLPTDEIQVGIWNYETSDWVGGSPGASLLWPPDSSLWGHYIGPGITLNVRKEGSHNSGPVSMTLAKLFLKNPVPVGGPNTTQATAALSGWGGTLPGTPVFPGGPSEGTLPKPGEGTYPYYHATMKMDGTDTFGWSSLNPNGKTNAAEVKKILKDPTGTTTPDCPPGSPVGIQNGVVADAITTMTANNNMFGLVETPTGSGVYMPSTFDNLATDPVVSYKDTIYMLPVFETIPDDKFNQTSITGGVQVKIVQVTKSPENTIDFEIIAPGGGTVVPGYGGGKWYGILATEPKLVQ